MIGLIDDIPTVAELVERMVNDCHAAIENGLKAFRG